MTKLRRALLSIKLPRQTNNMIFTDGVIALCALYNASKTISDIDHYIDRYIAFTKAVVKKSAISLATLPPT